MPSSLPDYSDGPDAFRGSLQCLNHHAGVTAGITDWCCCCNPCLYERPLSQEHPCRCVPKIICFVFKGDADQSECCKEYTVSAVGVPGIYTTTYSATLGGVDLTLVIDTDLATPSILSKGSSIYGIPAFWRFTSYALGIDEIYRIDHTHITCLAPPNIELSGVTIVTPDGHECVGTITFESYKSAKVEFKRILLEPSEDIEIPYRPDPLCNCGFAVDTLCVYGRRKKLDLEHQTLVEAVQFTWDRGNNDRWSYTPPCGDPDHDQEHIYLRGDEYGNCWLELDFDQDGDSTNDWADPVNTFDGNYPHEIREGMLPIDSCVCGLRVRSTTTYNRHVVITAGYCEKYKYDYCGKCRCVPLTLCVRGDVDGVHFNGQMTWNGEAWEYFGSPTTTPFTLSLTKGVCALDPPPGRTDPSVCVIKANGTLLLPFLNSEPVNCDPFLSFTLGSTFDPTRPTLYSWLWGWASRCGGCKDANCGPCVAERCGGPPDVLYADCEAIRRNIIFLYNDPAQPFEEVEYCDIQVRMEYYQRWIGQTSFCGYIGTAPLPGGGTFMLEWIFSGAETFRMTRIEASGVTTEDVNFGSDYYTCDPFLKEFDWKTQLVIPWHHCAWGVYNPYSVGAIEYRITVSE